ncbi:MAG: hypothetical protein IPM95_09075 [Sphingobacteriales bacterium]|jgi:hypothetical protein|nr:hypothetical protein [Sphingobacteriales bacterium]
MKKYTPILLTALILSCFSSCTCQQQKSPPKKEKVVKKSEVQVDIIRFEKELFACNPDELENELARLDAKYPLFYKIFYHQVLNIPATGNKEMQLQVMRDFLTKKAMRGLYDTVQQRFADIAFLKEDLQTAFANYKSYFPEKPTPKVITCISEFSYSVFTATDSILGISLDKYLGPGYIYYPAVFQEYTFMIPTFDQKYMAIDCANVLGANIVPVPDDKSTLLDKMVAEGKILFFIQSLLPQEKENDIIKYTEKQWKWCKDNEQQIWAYFLEKNLLYDTKFEQFKYVKEGPTTYGMPKESPGKAGAWLGWQIVQKYMEENPDTTLKELFAVSDGQKILTASKYKPKVK